MTDNQFMKVIIGILFAFFFICAVSDRISKKEAEKAESHRMACDVDLLTAYKNMTMLGNVTEDGTWGLWFNINGQKCFRKMSKVEFDSVYSIVCRKSH
jgi:hypothetical protein